MQVQTGYLYHIKDEFFDKIKDKILEELENSLKNCTRINVVKDTIKVVKEYLDKEDKLYKVIN
ncbi:MAG: hypothetical protein IJY25_02035 [Bacilli bacterium]|nr:hypothetical protein [Bacilli bacterium]